MFLLERDKFMPKMHLRQPGFTYSLFTKKTKKEYKNLKKQEIYYEIYYLCFELDKACFQHDMAYRDFKDLTRKTAADKILRNKSFNIAKNPKYDGYQRDLVSMVCEFFYKKISGSGIKNETISNKQLAEEAEELHKPINRKTIKVKYN